MQITLISYMPEWLNEQMKTIRLHIGDQTKLPDHYRHQWESVHRLF